MPEAFAVIFVFVVTVAAYVGAKIHAGNPSLQEIRGECTRLRQHRAWLEERLQLAWRENWGQEMRDRIADEIEATEAQLAQALANRKPTAS
jgi:hypothetical protein